MTSSGARLASLLLLILITLPGCAPALAPAAPTSAAGGAPTSAPAPAPTVVPPTATAAPTLAPATAAPVPTPEASPSAPPAPSPTAVPVVTSAPARERVPLSIALDWTPNTNHTGVFVAQALGWYADEGLDVTILPYAEGATPDVQVAAGSADFGFSYEEAVTVARAAGQPVVSVAAVIQHNTSAFVTLKESGLDRPAKLEGKRYAGFGAPFEEAVIRAIITCDGGTSGTVENITTNVFGFQALAAGQADFVWIFQGWEGVEAQRQGVALHAFSPTEYCVPDYYTPVIVTSERTIAAKPDAVRRFMGATARGYELAISDPDRAAELLLKSAPPGSLPDADLVKASARWLAPKYREGKPRWGEQDLMVWSDYPRFMIKSGKLLDASGKPVTTDLEYTRFFTNDFLPAAP